MEHIILSLIIDYFSTPNAPVTESAPEVVESYNQCFPTKQVCEEQFAEIKKIMKSGKVGKERIANYRVVCLRHMTPEEKDEASDIAYNIGASFRFSSELCRTLNHIYDEQKTKNAIKAYTKE